MTLFLGTGCGRSGTLWTAKFFTELGFPAFHETQFGAVSQRELRFNEISWLAVPFLSGLPENTRVLRVVRNPYDSVLSGMQMEFQKEKRGTAFDRFLADHRPDIVEPEDKLTRIIRWVASWDDPVGAIPHTVIRPDIDPIHRLGEVVEYATGETVSQRRMAVACRKLGSNINTKRRSVSVTIDDVKNHPEGWKIRRRAERFGYV